ncbi:MAG: sulfur carrier protein ThiS adenylyltransferase ThiF [Thermoplasmatota archaeon]
MIGDKQQKIRARLKTCCVGIAGVGGLGSNAAISLIRAGVGSFVLVDFDNVEQGNLNRQYYFRDQIGAKKVDALKENFIRINPSVSVGIHCEKLLPGSMTRYFKEVDVIVEALDDAQTKIGFIEEVLQMLPDTPLVAASGVAGYGHSDRISTRKVGNLYVCYDENAKSSDEDVLMAPKVCLMANWQANIVLEILLGEES